MKSIVETKSIVLLVILLSSCSTLRSGLSNREQPFFSDLCTPASFSDPHANRVLLDIRREQQRERLMIALEYNSELEHLTFIGLNTVGAKRFELAWQGHATQFQGALGVKDESEALYTQLSFASLLHVHGLSTVLNELKRSEDTRSSCKVTLSDGFVVIDGRKTQIKLQHYAPESSSFILTKLGYNVALSVALVD